MPSSSMKNTAKDLPDPDRVGRNKNKNEKFGGL